jgi:hypothetical protein
MIPFSGYSIASIGPCRTYTINGVGGNVLLDNFPGTPAPSAAFSNTLASAYPKAGAGGCIDCKKLN